MNKETNSSNGNGEIYFSLYGGQTEKEELRRMKNADKLVVVCHLKTNVGANYITRLSSLNDNFDFLESLDKSIISRRFKKEHASRMKKLTKIKGAVMRSYYNVALFCMSCVLLDCKKRHRVVWYEHYVWYMFLCSGKIICLQWM